MVNDYVPALPQTTSKMKDSAEDLLRDSQYRLWQMVEPTLFQLGYFPFS